MFIEYDYQQVEVPQEILRYCDQFTMDSHRNELKYLDCVYMNMGYYGCLLYTSPSPRDQRGSRMPSSA